ncbi:MAG: hypothetical protein BWX83_00459 [Candidatus Cloacimonetes bacterium ADurb.Bin117]|nr:MAG: hypothetical protein BWX83_00459 [Candidatus Cloacimonetes bacterium ADurb.Bin117]
MIHADEVQVLFLKLFPGVGDQIVGLRGKAHQLLFLGFLFSELGKDIRRGRQFQVEAAAFLDLVGRCFERLEIRYGGTFHDYSAAFGSLDNGVIHQLHRGCEDGLMQIVGRGFFHQTVDQSDLGAPEGESPGDGQAHPAAGFVGDQAHGIYRFCCGACGDQNADPVKVFRIFQIAADGICDLRVGRILSLALISAGEQPYIRLQNMVSPLSQDVKVGLCGLTLIHVHIHRRNVKNRLGMSQQSGGKQIVGNALGRLGKDVGCGGSHHDQVRPVRQSDVRNGIGVLEKLAVHAAVGDGGEVDPRHKARGIFSQDGLHAVTRLAQLAGQVDSFVSGDAAAHAK